MSVVTKVSTASVDTSTAQFAPQISGLVAGETIGVCDFCYIKASDGKVYKSNGTAANAAAKCDGMAAEAAKAGQGVTLLGVGTRMKYGSGLTIAALYYIAATAGALDTAATTGGLTPVAKAITATDIVIVALVP